MYNIKKAVSRLDFAPRIEQIKVTDIKNGLGVFTPKPDKPASFAALKAALKKAGYTLASAEITVSGKLARDDSGWWIEADPSKQRFLITGDDINQTMQDAAKGERVELTGSYRERGRIGGRAVPGSSSSEYYLAPGLQFTATPRLVLEASYRFPSC